MKTKIYTLALAISSLLACQNSSIKEVKIDSEQIEKQEEIKQEIIEIESAVNDIEESKSEIKRASSELDSLLETL